MSSGVGVNPVCHEKYQELKLGKKIKDKKEIVTTTDFLGDLPEAECRWAIYDFEYEKEDGGKRNKICFYSWSPDDAKIKDKMLFASSKDALRRAAVGVAVEIQGTDFSEIAYESVLDKASRGS
ncbi:actin depolymerizing factor [Armillaria novae-zelandiae]|uniref:Cofilin n=1 Tax=Armillaria novae-zelandiae TaxID=153914 RepID=A0AA39PUN0_9AGAR|nr:actin depolymerizing factor [Armillaria novae-zelandiae]